MTIDLVCWDFGDTLVDELFMRLPPTGVPEWGRVYDEVLAERPEWVEALNLGQGSLNDLIPALAERLPMMTRPEIAGHLRAVWSRIEWFDDARQCIERLDGIVTQAVVTVNPHEFSGIARACGLDALIPTLVTSADLASNSKVLMAEHARMLLGLSPGVSTTVLIDNKRHNTDEFVSAGGQAVLYERGANSLAALEALI